jgi:hypothetical protein
MRRQRALKIVLVFGIAVFGRRLPLDDDGQARPRVGDDDEPIRHARRFPAAGSPKAIRESEPGCLHVMVELCPRRRYVVPSSPKSDRTR